METFADAVKTLRKKKRITQRDLAETIGVDFTYISKIENNRLVHSPSEDIIRKMAVVLGADADELIVLAKKVPQKLQETIVSDDFVVNFLRVAPSLDSDQRKRIKLVMDETEGRNGK